MTLPFPIPDWLPWWVPLVVLVLGLLYLLVFLIMPFSVFGLKGRLDLIEARLEEIQLEIRMHGIRPPESRSYAGAEPPAFGRATQRPAPDEEDERERPPPRTDAPPPATRRRAPGEPPGKVEPRLDWPRP
jgi:disintegrin/metalloproteinase domain-containing protein 1